MPDHIFAPDFPTGLCAVCDKPQHFPIRGSMTTREALYSFAAWLTTRAEPILSAPAGVIAELVNEFCKANGLPSPHVNIPESRTHDEKY